MKRVLASLIFIVVAPSLTLGQGQDQGQDRARDILAKAIDAAGGAKKLSEFRALHAKYEATGSLGATDTPCTLEAFFQWPDQLKTELRCDFKGQKFILIQVINGDKAWRSENGQTQEAQGHNLTELQEDMYFQRIEALLPLIKDPGYILSALDEMKVIDRPAMGIKVSSKGRRDINLYFDKETALLVKSEHYLTDLSGKEIYRETLFSDYRDLDGSKQFMKMAIYQDHKKVFDAKVIEIKLLDKIDNSVFSKP